MPLPKKKGPTIAPLKETMPKNFPNMDRLPTTWLFHHWESIRTSLWFIPTVLALSAVALAAATIGIDQWLGMQTEWFRESYLAGAGPEGARVILSTIAGSVITVTGVTFSITIVALTLASSQFGPRLLRNFMKDKGNQLVLGAFIATFIYCVIVLRSIHSDGEENFIPNISLTLAVILVCADVFVLIYFIHHISASIQADNVIEDVYDELEWNIHRIFPEELDREGNSPDKIISPDYREKACRPFCREIKSPATGYVQAIDYETLMEIGRNSECLILLRTRAGKFSTTGDPIASVGSDEPLDRKICKKIAGSFIFGSIRTPEQDVEYAIHQLVEVGVRSLSPGINDPYTTIACIDRLGAALCLLANKQFPSPYLNDEEGQVRLIMDVTTFSGMTNAAFDQIRQYGRSSVAVTIRLIETLANIAGHARLPEQRRTIVRQAEMILRTSREFKEKNDREDVERRYRGLLNFIASNGQARGSNG